MCSYVGVLMKNYLEGILTVLLVGTLASILMPDGEGRRFVRFALSILVLAAVMSPFRTGEVVRFLSSYTPGAFEEQAQDGEAYLLEHEEKAIEEGLSSALAEKHGLPFVLLADPECVDINAYGVWKEKTLYGKTAFGVSRTTFLIDAEGVIERVMPKVKPDTNAAEILAELNGEN